MFSVWRQEFSSDRECANPSYLRCQGKFLSSSLSFFDMDIVCSLSFSPLPPPLLLPPPTTQFSVCSICLCVCPCQSVCLCLFVCLSVCLSLFVCVFVCFIVSVTDTTMIIAPEDVPVALHSFRSSNCVCVFVVVFLFLK